VRNQAALFARGFWFHLRPAFTAATTAPAAPARARFFDFFVRGCGNAFSFEQRIDTFMSRFNMVLAFDAGLLDLFRGRFFGGCIAFLAVDNDAFEFSFFIEKV
jgi:hypothetical protein